MNSAAGIDGWDMGGLPLPCSLPFFKGLRCLVNVVFGRYGGLLREAINDALQMPGYTQIDLGYSYECLDVSLRLKVMLVLSWLLEDWPERLRIVGADRMPALSHVREDRGFMPFWVEAAWLRPKNRSKQ